MDGGGDLRLGFNQTSLKTITLGTTPACGDDLSLIPRNAANRRDSDAKAQPRASGDSLGKNIENPLKISLLSPLSCTEYVWRPEGAALFVARSLL